MAIAIHRSGTGSDAFEVVSYHNGLAYSFNFGEAGAPMRNLFFQGDDAIALRDEFDALEDREPETLTRELWLRLLDPYL